MASLNVSAGFKKFISNGGSRITEHYWVWTAHIEICDDFDEAHLKLKQQGCFELKKQSMKFLSIELPRARLNGFEDNHEAEEEKLM
ncbi:hypothetical protein ACLOJK_033797 [Asimina triloba]